MHLDPHKTFFVQKGTSDVANDSVLQQNDISNVLCPIIYSRRALSKRERGYSTYVREAIATRETIRHFHHYLLCRSFALKTNYKPLMHLKGKEGPVQLAWEISKWYCGVRLYYSAHWWDKEQSCGCLEKVWFSEKVLITTSAHQCLDVSHPNQPLPTPRRQHQ